MTGAQQYLGILLLLTGTVAAQLPLATINRVSVARQGTSTIVEIELDAPVQATATTAENPPRVVITFPNTRPGATPPRSDVNAGGIRSIQTISGPQTTEVVVEAERSYPFALTTKGKVTRLTIVSAAGTVAERRIPAAAAKGGWTGIFRRQQRQQVPATADSTPLPVPPPPASGPPLTFPPTQTTAGSSTTTQSKPDTTASRASSQPGGSFDSVAAAQTSAPAQANSPQSPGFDSAHTAATSSAGHDSATTNTGSFDTPAGAHATSATVSIPDTSAGSQEPVASANSESATPADTRHEEQTVQAFGAVDPSLRTVFRVKYVAEGVAYLDGGRSSSLTEGMKLEVMETDLDPKQGTIADPSDPRVVAELQISGVAETSAVCDIHGPKRPVKAGDLAYLSLSDAAALVQQRTLSTTRKYPAVVSFTQDDPLDEEARALVPRPPLPSVNRARGRIGLDYLGTVSHDSSGIQSSDLGLVIRTDITRINGTYWNASGYWRGRLASHSSTSQPTLQDLINRTYHLSLSYDNPNSAWVAGFGRLYLPWAPSLDTIDGGYFGRRVGHIATAGIFAGSTPDPTSWSYNPNQQIGGAFINFEGGSYENLHYSSTSGIGANTISFQVTRPFIFFENSASYKNRVSFYDSLQADNPMGNPAVPSPGPGLGRNFLTVRFQVTPRVEVHFNHNYFRDVPTFDPTLIGTGLLDKYLFQGFSAGTRVEVIKHLFLYSDLGRSNRSGDASSSLNQLYGIGFDRLPWFGLRADAHYSRFNSSFGNGSYEAFSLSRNLTDVMQLEILAGQQRFTSLLSTNNSSRFVNANLQTNVGAHYFMQGGFTFNRGSLSYDQWSLTLGYRFDSRSKRK